jgi:hypothetical protein
MGEWTPGIVQRIVQKRSDYPSLSTLRPNCRDAIMRGDGVSGNCVRTLLPDLSSGPAGAMKIGLSRIISAICVTSVDRKACLGLVLCGSLITAMLMNAIEDLYGKRSET